MKGRSTIDVFHTTLDHFRPDHSGLPYKSATPSRIWSNCNLYDFELDAEDIQRLDALDQGDNGAVSWNPIHAD
jgi:hypothetical protein